MQRVPRQEPGNESEWSLVTSQSTLGGGAGADYDGGGADYAVV